LRVLFPCAKNLSLCATVPLGRWLHIAQARSVPGPA
jgi:hypothetical protein